MSITREYRFHKTKYGDELLIDVVELKDIKKYLSENALHTLTYYDITLVTEGSGEFRIDNETYAVQNGEALFTAPNQFRRWDTDNIIDGYALIFEEEFLLSFFNDADFLGNLSYFSSAERATSRLTLSTDEFNQILSLIKNIKNEIRLYREKDKHILRAILYQVLKYLDRLFIRENKIADRKFRNCHTHNFIKLVNSSYQQYHSVNYYAGKLCLTPNYLNELVKKETGLTAKQLINNKLLAEAKKLLLYSPLSVMEIGNLLNFENPSYFVRFFRNHCGLTPMKYRNGRKP